MSDSEFKSQIDSVVSQTLTKAERIRIAKMVLAADRARHTPQIPSTEGPKATSQSAHAPESSGSAQRVQAPSDPAPSSAVPDNAAPDITVPSIPRLKSALPKSSTAKISAKTFSKTLRKPWFEWHEVPWPRYTRGAPPTLDDFRSELGSLKRTLMSVIRDRVEFEKTSHFWLAFTYTFFKKTDKAVCKSYTAIGDELEYLKDIFRKPDLEWPVDRKKKSWSKNKMYSTLVN